MRTDSGDITKVNDTPFVVQRDLPLAINEQGGRMQVSYEDLNSVADFLHRAGYAVIINNAYLAPGGWAEVLYYRLPIPVPQRPWWKRLLRLA